MEALEVSGIRQRVRDAAGPIVQQMQAFVDAMQSRSWKGHWQHITNHPRWKRYQRGCYNLRITLICGFMTLLVLRGTMGAGKFGTIEQDVTLVRRELQNLQARRIIQKKPSLNGDASRLLQAMQETTHDPSVPYSLGPPVKDWDQQRVEYFATHLRPNGTLRRWPKMLLVTSSRGDTCQHPVGDHLLLKSLKNKMDYCRLKDIEVHFNMAEMDPKMSGPWAKLPLLRRLMLVRPDVEWFWWIDPDAFISDMRFNIPMKKYLNHSLVLHGWEDLVYEQMDWVGLSTGSFLLRNNQWSLDLLDEWSLMGPRGQLREEAGRILTAKLQGRPEFEADDQSALVWIMNQQRNKWGSQIYLESSYHLHGYWVKISNRFEEMVEKQRPGFGDDRWPFVTDFVGCKPCEEFGQYDVERCIDQMNRAFNFGDNQLLRRYGFQHVSLSSAAVMKINITTRASIAESHALPKVVKPKQEVFDTPPAI